MSIIVANDLRGQDRPASREITQVRPSIVPRPSSGSSSVLKVMFDFVVALLLLIVTAPLVALAVLLIKLTSRGPALYTQTRMGKNGKPFTILKLRTMSDQCESLTGVRWATPNDPRITPLGRILRKTHVDELPQLWNVLKGDMSMIGPRPERPEFLPQLEHAIPHYRGRLLVKPGVTGLAQVQLPADTNLASVRLKLAYDLYYVQHGSLWLDCRLCLSTACKMFSMSFAILGKLFRLPKQEVIEAEYKLLSAK